MTSSARAKLACWASRWPLTSRPRASCTSITPLSWETAPSTASSDTARPAGGSPNAPSSSTTFPAATIHDGGRLRFGPDGLLYATAGDAANSSLAQDPASLAGKFLRIERDGLAPRGNPFGSPVFSWGHRNPQGFDWHPATGDIWATEHGNSGNDEINVVRAGVNYGWPTIEAAQTFPNMEPPVTFFNPAIAPSGAAFYQGTRFPQFAGNLFAATLRGTHLLRLVVDAQGRRVTRQERLLEGTFGRLRDVAVGPDGYIYFCTNNRDGRGSPAAGDDRIIRLSPVS